MGDLEMIDEAILEISEDQLTGFRRDPISDIAVATGFDDSLVIDRLRAMLRSGRIRRIRQTLLATNLAQGALIAWDVPDDLLTPAFDFLYYQDPFTGHVVSRTAELPDSSARFRLWTTLKVPEPFSLRAHCETLKEIIRAKEYRAMPPLRMFALGVGHTRRKGLPPGAKSDQLAEATTPAVVSLSEEEWRVLMALKREFTPEELGRDLWEPRAAEAAVPLTRFFRIAEQLDRRGVIGRFSTFLEHSKPIEGKKLNGAAGLFHWSVPPGREIEAGREIGRHLILTHCYWRDGGPSLANANIMAVAHGSDRAAVLAHKGAIDTHLQSVGIEILHSNVFWSDRAEIKPSEISPMIYRQWIEKFGLATSSV